MGETRVKMGEITTFDGRYFLDISFAFERFLFNTDRPNILLNHTSISFFVHSSINEPNCYVQFVNDLLPVSVIYVLISESFSGDICLYACHSLCNRTGTTLLH